jgi:hypothetical protein
MKTSEPERTPYDVELNNFTLQDLDGQSVELAYWPNSQQKRIGKFRICHAGKTKWFLVQVDETPSGVLRVNNLSQREVDAIVRHPDPKRGAVFAIPTIAS